MDLFPMIAAERMRLADGLDALGPPEWEAPSLCAGWTVHVVGAHLNAPFEVSAPAVLFQMARARSLDGGFDRVARRLAERLDPAACIAGLRDHADSRFTPPGSGPEAPLTDVIVHGADMLASPCGLARPTVKVERLGHHLALAHASFFGQRYQRRAHRRG